MSDKQCSQLFDDVFSTGGTCRLTCACGRVHFDGYNQGNSWEEGELESLMLQAKDTPDKVIEHDGSLGWLEIGGLQIVCGCTCDIAAKYERFIITASDKLAEYLRLRAKALREQADRIDIPAEVA